MGRQIGISPVFRLWLKENSGRLPQCRLAHERGNVLTRRLALFAFLFTFLLPLAAQAEQPWFFAVLSDPQFGMYAKDQNFAQETANFEFAVATLNRLHPRFVVICGDLVNRTGDAAEIAEYKRILRQLDPSIPVYSVAGNHDVGNTPSEQTIAAYRSAIGRDYYTFTAGSVFGIVLDSNLMTSPGKASQEALQQDEWLKKTLAQAKADSAHQTIVFQHIPYFLHNSGEPDDYFNFPQAPRRKYLDMLEGAGVRSVFAGHYHRNAGGIDGPLTEWVVGAVGMPIAPAVSGFRIVTVNGDKLDSRWYCLAGLPNQVDPIKLPATTCP